MNDSIRVTNAWPLQNTMKSPGYSLEAGKYRTANKSQEEWLPSIQIEWAKINEAKTL